MKDKWFIVIQFVSGIFLFLFSIFLIFAIIKLIPDDDFRYALVGALGSVIGGSLTLIGVYFTLKKQNDEKFVSDFPNIIRNIDLIVSEISRINERHSFLNSGIKRDYSHEIKDYINDLKQLSINVDGHMYFLVKKIETEFELLREQMKQIRYDEDEFGGYEITNESKEFIEETQANSLENLQNILRKIKDHELLLTKRFFKLTQPPN